MGTGQQVATILFAAQPGAGAERSKLKVLRAKPGRPASGVMVSREMVGCFTHYYSGRSAPCEGGDCVLCGAGNAKRWYSWLAIMDDREQRLMMLELTASAAVDLWRERQNVDNLRGFTIFAERSGKRSNAPLDARIVMKPRKLVGLPVEPDLQSILLRMWERGAKAAAAKLSATPPQIVVDSCPEQTYSPVVV